LFRLMSMPQLISAFVWPFLLTVIWIGGRLYSALLGDVGSPGEEEWVENVVGIGQVSPDREAVIRALDSCYDPCCRDRKISVVDMGLIESVEIRDREVRIEMVLTTGWCPFASRLLEMVKVEVGSLPGVDEVDVEVVWDPTWTPERMSGEARKKLTLPLEKLAPLREARLRGESA
jgi:metal-sulfur cluster biosynthetic enzyme